MVETSIKKLVIGFCVTGNSGYWAMATVMLKSVIKNIDVRPSRVLLATDQLDSFEAFKKIFANDQIEFTLIEPSKIYSEIAPELKGNFSTYWKFDLFRALSFDEVLMYIDVDAVAIRELRVASIMEHFFDHSVRLAAVPSPRPVLERYSTLRLNNPYDYFNAGVLFGVSDGRYAIERLAASIRQITKLDTLGLYWHDQDLFNFIFNSKYFKIPYVYNVHSGYLYARFRGASSLNELAANDIHKNAVIIHFSGDYLLSKKFHPYKKNVVDLITTIFEDIPHPVDQIDRALSNLMDGLRRVRNNARDSGVDYWLQCFRLRRRLFDSRYYFANVKATVLYIRKYVLGKTSVA